MSATVASALGDLLGGTLIPWLNISSPRAGRQYLEAHPELLRPESDLLFDALAKQYATDGDALNSLAIHRAILRSARARGDSQSAIRDAYIDVHGGLALDVPEWLAAIEQQSDALEQQGQSAQPARDRVALWQAALDRAPKEEGIPAEVLAAIEQSLWEALYYAGTGDPTMQEQGIAALESAQAGYPRERYPIQWAMVQSNLGRMYSDRMAGGAAENLERAIGCLSGTLEVFAPDQLPLQWATTQDNLGNAYRVRISGEQADNLEQALACFEASLRVYARDVYPAQWANAQNNLGLVYADRIHGSRAENLEQAITCYTSALEVYTQQAYPQPWAMVQNNLGIAYRNRIQGDPAENQERAMAFYTAALEVRTRDALPADWAATQNNLGRLYLDRVRGDRAQNVEHGLTCFTDALQVRTRAVMPASWALTQNNLGDAYLGRGVGNRAENVEQALACYTAAAEVYTREAYPLDWAATQRNLAGAYAERITGERAQNLEQALALYGQALTVYSREGTPMLWAQTRAELGSAYAARIRGDTSENLEQALTCYADALTVLIRDAFPGDWATTQINLGNAYLNRIAGDHAENLERGIACYQDALNVVSRDANPAEWAKVRFNLAAAYFQRVQGDRAENLEQALQEVNASLEIYTRESSPTDWAGARYNLGQILIARIRGETAENVEQALAAFGDSLSVYTSEVFPYEFARTQLGLGSAYRARLRGERAQNLELALAADTVALQVYTRDAYPADWALAQNNLGIDYADRIQGEHADNLERALLCYQSALEVRTRDTLPLDWAATQMNLATAYAERIRDDRTQNLERSIECYESALTVFTRNAEPLRWAQVQDNLGSAYAARPLGESGENIDRAILCYQAALEVYTREGSPLDWARLQNNLGDAFYRRIRGERSENLEHALALFTASEDVYTRDGFPASWALARRNQGRVFLRRVVGDRLANMQTALARFEEALTVYTRAANPREWASTQSLIGNALQDQVHDGVAPDPAAASERAVAAYRCALEVRTREADPLQFRRTNIALAEAEAQRGSWEAAHAAYEAARLAEEQLLALSTGAHGRDIVLQMQEGREAGPRDGFVLAQLGRLEDAMLAVERSRAQGLAELRSLQSADPARISDPQRRQRFLAARDAFIEAQAAMNLPPNASAAPDEQRASELARATTLREAQARFDAVEDEIRAAGDPADFLRESLDLATLAQARTRGPAGHSLVYLVATPWGGLALAALAGDRTSGIRVASLPLPQLTSDFVADLIQAEMDAQSGKVIGGFGHAQEGRGLSFISYYWLGDTLAEKAASLHAACVAAGRESALDLAAQQILAYPAVKAIAAKPLGQVEYAQLDPTFEFAYLQQELRRCLPKLAAAAINPLATWLQTVKASSVTLIPTGALATFPLAAVPVGTLDDLSRAYEWQTFGDALVVTTAPSARSLLEASASVTKRKGVATLGDPRPTHQELQWGEAEAQTLAKLGGDTRRVRLHEQATREWLLEALRTAEVVDACCHGEFDPLDFLSSRLLLAGGERLTLGELLGGATIVDGLRLLILSACQTGILDLRGARDEVRSLAAGMLQAGAQAVLGTQWSVDDKATYLLMVRFAQEWFSRRDREPPASALARASRWLRGVTNRELRKWEKQLAAPAMNESPSEKGVAVRGSGLRYGAAEAAERVAASAAVQSEDARPYADPIFWSAFQITGW
ncbi:MAG TPA: CHAT domain-containing protein [Ktedonobacterales bacterium]